jgi:hypothetical protein
VQISHSARIAGEGGAAPFGARAAFVQSRLSAGEGRSASRDGARFGGAAAAHAPATAPDQSMPIITSDAFTTA